MSSKALDSAFIYESSLKISAIRGLKLGSINCDPNGQPDPERWLPKYERTGYRKKRDRRNKDVIKGSQGSSHGQSEQYDFSKKVDEATDSPGNVEPSPRGAVNKQNQHQNKKSNQKKKNKRR